MMDANLEQTVRRAREGGLDDFADLVHEFQDVTLGYARAYLGDVHLAEDASQEAWLRAWTELPRLREPAAFPGWLRRVTLACCSRFVRGHRLSVVPLDLVHDVATGEEPADERLVALERERSVRQAVQTLPEHQREAVLLYYMARCSQRQVAIFLEVPESTVKKRLHDARRRLKERMLDMVRKEMERSAPSTNEVYAKKVLDGIRATQTRQTGASSVICCMQPMLAAAGVEVSVSRLAGIFGHAFSFYLRRERGPDRIWQDENIDWQFFWQGLDLVERHFEEAQAIGTRDTREEVRAAQERAWEGVRRSIDQGVPAMAWNPMTREQKERGFSAYEWGLLTGYDAEQGTYTVRHKGQTVAYEIPHDGFGDTDDVHWFAAMWPAGVRSVDSDQVVRRSLQQAVDYARGVRYEKVGMQPCFPVDAVGLAAYELWAERLRGDMTVDELRTQAGLLAWARQQASSFCRELGSSSPSAKGMEAAAAHYDEEVGALTELGRLCGEVTLAHPRLEEALSILEKATEAERRAIEELEAVL